MSYDKTKKAAFRQTAIFPLSGDPITLGHVDIITRASEIFPEIIVLIADNPQKKYMLPMELRKETARVSLKNIRNVTVDSTQGLVADYAYERKIRILIRGLRNEADLHTEVQLHQGNVAQNEDLETMYLLAEKNFADVSSSLIRVLVTQSGDIRNFVPICVKQKLEEYVAGQYRVCVTGPIASGKSEVLRHISEMAEKMSIPCSVIDMDEVTKDIYAFPEKYNNFQDELTRVLGTTILHRSGGINLKKVKEIIFSDADGKLLRRLNDIFESPLQHGLHCRLAGQRGLIFIAGARITQYSWLSHANFNTLYVYASDAIRKERLIQRDRISKVMAERKLSLFGTGRDMCKEISEAIQSVNYGTLVQFCNENALSSGKVLNLLRNIVKIFPQLEKIHSL